jgi:hypothetical protein
MCRLIIAALRVFSFEVLEGFDDLKRFHTLQAHQFMLDVS